jgi:hypothetical protein
MAGGGIVKTFKCPAQYDARVIEAMFNEIFTSVQSRNFQTVSGIPENAKGSSGEVWVDNDGTKFYIKVGSTWKTGTLS